MKFYSYSNENGNYTKALFLENVRSVQIAKGNGKSLTRFSVNVNYLNGAEDSFNWLHEEESKKVYNEIITLLNKE